MPSIIDKNLLPEFDTIKDDDEKILWTDKPKFIPYAITSLGLGFGVFILSAFILLWLRILIMKVALLVTF